MKKILFYVPVIQKSYLDFLSAHTDAGEIYTWGESLILREEILRKEIRALTPVQAAVLLKAVTGREIKIAEFDDLGKILKSADPLILPDDAISRSLVEKVISPLGIKSYMLYPIFLRWDKNSSTAFQAVAPDKTINKESFRSIISKADQEAEKSSDWWRRVGAVLFDSGRNIFITAHNVHLPTEYAPYISGDPRASFSKGINIDLSTAVHAEVQVLGEAAKNGFKTKGLGLLVTTFPCPTCAKLIASCGIGKLYYLEGYSMVDGEKEMRDSGVKIIRIA